MRLVLFVCCILVTFDIFSQSNAERNCLPTTSIRGAFCPDSIYCPCLPNARCWHRVIANDKNLTVIGFKIIANGLEGQQEDNIIAETNGNEFSPHMLLLFSKAQKGSKLEFACIRAKNIKGQIFILQPFTIVAGER
ncbi:MAG: hypothetical protein ACT4OJ_05685 [Bacteroidota bacterium]